VADRCLAHQAMKSFATIVSIRHENGKPHAQPSYIETAQRSLFGNLNMQIVLKSPRLRDLG